MTKTILVIDDEIGARTLLRIYFERVGYTMFDAKNGEEGLLFLSEMQTPPDCIMCDEIMPDMSGTEVLGKIRSSSEWSHIPFLISSVTSDHTELCTENTKYLRFPFLAPQLYVMVDMLLV